ncbi:biotin transporter BioY [Corynebacterium aquatimens]|uniref:biotin transporter BioY n=1 Tax=Corynebacterium TaxID=1716 RepID=UPI001F17747D|nr:MULTISPECIES: biotin transporter BioY [Corynebacterium]QYH19601.1 biotin transporter BioY [Corynebacterium aquatimens]UIZ91422.1 biotin transporter BioY [Corynebacterium sp. CNCTC7651]
MTTAQPAGANTPSNNTPSKNTTATDIAYIAVFAAIIIVLGFLAIPVGAAGVPIVLQNAAVILAGLVLGRRRGLATAAIFLLVGLALPVLAGGRTTIAAIGGPTVGYLVGYLVSAWVAGAIAYTAPFRTNRGATIGILIVAGYVALFFQYLFGVFGMMWRLDMTFGAAWAAQVPFLLPDAGKIALMIAIALAVHAAFPDLRRSSTRA